MQWEDWNCIWFGLSGSGRCGDGFGCVLVEVGFARVLKRNGRWFFGEPKIYEGRDGDALIVR